MGAVHQGGCLCGATRYEASADPLRVTICHCTFCQRFTGSAFLVEPIFRKSDIAFSGAALKTYDHRSDSSHKRVTLNFCGTCGTTLYLDLERFPDILGLCGGTFDDPIDKLPAVRGDQWHCDISALRVRLRGFR